MRMSKKEKKSWKEIQRERQRKQQQERKVFQKEQEQRAKTKPRKMPIGKIAFLICLISIITIAIVAWQYTEGQKPPTIGGDNIEPAPSGLAPTFSLKDINGKAISLSQFDEGVIGVHFMAVGCGGQIYPINQYQLSQLKSVCNTYCGNKAVNFITVAVATCENSALDQIRKNYGITWTFGNDYDDKVLDIVEAYISQGIADGSIVLIDKTFNIAQVYNNGVAANTLSSKISQLLEE